MKHVLHTLSVRTSSDACEVVAEEDPAGHRIEPVRALVRNSKEVAVDILEMHRDSAVCLETFR